MKVPFCNDIIWTDRIWTEGNKGWFVLAAKNALFEMDMELSECKLLTILPDFTKWRSNPTCIKYKNHILCMPDHGENIWDYDIETGNMDPIHILQDDTKEVRSVYHWIVEDIMYAVSNSWKQVIVIDLQKREVIERVSIADESVVFGQSILVENSIYTVSQSSSNIYEYNIDEKCVTVHDLNNISSNLFTIVYDGNNFWLSGTCKEIYVWNKAANVVEVIQEFPDDLGKYLFEKNDKDVLDCQSFDLGERIFAYSINSKRYMWFVPYNTNKILYVNKGNYHVSVLEIGEEIETRETLSSRIWYDKFFAQYIENGKLLNLYSMKNKKFLEIDMDECTWRYKNVEIDLNKGICGVRNKDIIKEVIFSEAEYIFFCAMLFGEK